MGRKSKLTPEQWEEVLSKAMAEDSSKRAIAKEYGIAESSLRGMINARLKVMKEAAGQIVAAEKNLAKLPHSAQVMVMDHAAQLLRISNHLLVAAMAGARDAEQLACLASRQVDKIDADNPLESAETLSAISALTRLKNESAKLAVDLTKSPQSVQPLPPPNQCVVEMTDEELMAIASQNG